MAGENLVELFKKRTRHPYRPRASDVIEKLFVDFDPFATPDRSLVAGRCHFQGKRLYVVAQQKPKPEDLQTTEDLQTLNYGMLTSDGHSFILNLLEQAAAEDPDKTAVFTIIDTYGADISMYSAQRFQAFFIAQLIRRFLQLPLRTVSLILGEGGSGGALALQVTDVRGQLDDALYATAPPESMASIVFRDASRIQDALTILKPTAKELKGLGVIDRIVPAPPDVTNIEALGENIAEFLTKALRDTFRSRIKSLVRRRRQRAQKFGVYKGSGPLYDFKRYIEAPLKKVFRKPPPDIKIVTSSSAIEVSDEYKEILYEAKQTEFIECGGIAGEGVRHNGCGKLIPLKDFLDNFNVCPECGYAYTLDASGWIDCLADPGTFHELYRNLRVDDLLEDESLTQYYREFLAKQVGRSHFKESLVVGTARVHHFPVVMAISEFYFCGGSMGVVFGEKFRRAVDFAIRERLPLVSLCCSGGARLYEGISALMQMVKTVDAVNRLKTYRLPYLSILADPSTGGAIASYAALGDVIIAEPGALIIFAGPRVMQSRGFEVDEKLVRSQHLHEFSERIYDQLDYYHQIRGVQEIAGRKKMKNTLARYLELYDKTRLRPPREKRSARRVAIF